MSKTILLLIFFDAHVFYSLRRRHDCKGMSTLYIFFFFNQWGIRYRMRKNMIELTNNMVYKTVTAMCNLQNHFLHCPVNMDRSASHRREGRNDNNNNNTVNTTKDYNNNDVTVDERRHNLGFHYVRDLEESGNRLQFPHHYAFVSSKKPNK